MIQVRPATDADSAALIDLQGAVFAEYEGCVLDVDGEIPGLRRPASHWAERGGAIWVVETDDGRVAGSLAIDPIAGGAAMELHWMYVASAARGTGMATALWAEGLAFARGRGVARIELWTDTRFLRGHAFYRKLGFVQSPHTRALNDLSHTVEYHFALTIAD